jgi:hypothetical protein
MKSTIDSLLSNIMDIHVLRMGGAAAGIVGSGGDDSLAVQEAKSAAIAFADEYRKQKPDTQEVERLMQNVEGRIRVLELTKVVSEGEAYKLIDELHSLR